MFKNSDKQFYRRDKVEDMYKVREGFFQGIMGNVLQLGEKIRKIRFIGF